MSVISVKNVTKVYPLYDKPMDRLKETLSPLKKTYHTDFYALNDVSFDIAQGETVGIIGTNGSGKSTILKIITGVLTPTSGEVGVAGKISALLELGAGFNMDYTGMENLYMNGTMMGYSRKEMEEKIPAILEFADIGDFIHQPVKTYSSGMFVRLAFALAISVEPEVMIVDEALSVGDAFFQAKCFSKLEEIKKSGTTILFVSHDIISVKKLCKRAIWIEKGVVKQDGEASEVCEAYLSMQIEENNRRKAEMVDGLVLDNVIESEVAKEKVYFSRINRDRSSNITSTGKAEILSFYINNEKNENVTVLKTRNTYTFGVVVKFNEVVENALFGFEMENTKGTKLFSVNNFLGDCVLKKAEPGTIYEAKFEIELPRICTGEYLISPCVAAGNQDNHVVHERLHNFMLVTVDNDGYNLSIMELETAMKIVEHPENKVEIIG